MMTTPMPTSYVRIAGVKTQSMVTEKTMIKPWKSNKQQPFAVINQLTGVVATSDDPINGHNGGNDTIYFSVDFLLPGLMFPARAMRM